LGLADADFDVALVEPGNAGALQAKKRGLKNVICATLNTAKFKQQSLSAVGLFDVIEHIEDEHAFLQSIKDLIKKDGYLYATVPAYSFLWSNEDIYAGHFRRYTLMGICDILRSAGFHIEFSSYFFRFLTVPIFILRTLPYLLGFAVKTKKNTAISRDHTVNGPVTEAILNAVLQPEIKKLQNKKSMLFGGSCLVVAKNL